MFRFCRLSFLICLCVSLNHIIDTLAVNVHSLVGSSIAKSLDSQKLVVI